MAHLRTTHLKRAFRAAARHSVVGLSIVAVTFSGNLLAMPALAESGPPPEPLSVIERSIARDPERFYLPALSGGVGWDVREDGFREYRVGDARAVEPEPTLLPQGSFVPYRIWEFPDSLAVEFPSQDGSQMVRFSSASLSYGLSERIGVIDGYVHVADQQLSLQYRTGSSGEPSPTPIATPEPSDQPTPSESPTATPEEPSPTLTPAETPTPEATVEPTPTPEPSSDPTPEESVEPTLEPGPEEPLGLFQRVRQMIAPDARADEPTWESAAVSDITTTYDLGADAVTVHHRFMVSLDGMQRSGEIEAKIGFGATPLNKWTYAVTGEPGDAVDVRMHAATVFVGDAERAAQEGGSRYTISIDPADAEQTLPTEEIELYRPIATPEPSDQPTPSESPTATPEEPSPTLTPAETPTPEATVEPTPTPEPSSDPTPEESVEPTLEPTPEVTPETPEESPLGLLERIWDLLVPTAHADEGDPESQGDSFLGSIMGAVEDMFSDDSLDFVVQLRSDAAAALTEAYDADSHTSTFTYSSEELPPVDGYLLFVDPSFGAVQDAQGITVQSGDGSQSADFKLHFNPAYGGAIDELYQGGDFTANRVAVPASVSGSLTLVNIGDGDQAPQTAALAVEEASSVRVVVRNELPGLTERYNIYPSGRVVKAIVIDTPDDTTADFYLNGRADAYDAEAALPDDAMQLLVGNGPDLLLAWQDPGALASASMTSGPANDSRTTTVSVPLLAGQHTFYQLIELSRAGITMIEPATYLRYADDYRTPDAPVMTRGTFLGFVPSRAAYQFEAINNVAVFRLNGSTIPRIDPVFEVTAWSDPDLTAFKAQLNGHNMVEGVDYAIGFKNSDPSTGVLLFQYLHTIQQGDQFNVEGQDLPPLFDLDPSDAAAIKRVQRGTVNFTGTQTSITLTTPVVTSRSFALGGGAWGQGTSGTSQIPADSRLTYWLASPTELRIIRNASGTTASTSWEIVEFEDNSGALVQRGSVSMPTSTGTSNVSLPTTVNTAKAFPLISVRSAEATVATDDEDWTVRASLSATTLELSRNESDTSAINVSWQVVQLDGISVQRGLSSITTPTNVTISSVNTAKSFVVATARANTATAGVDSQYHFMASLTGSTTLALSKQQSTNALDIAWYVATFTGTSGSRVRSGTINDTILTKTSAAIAPTVVATRSFSLLTYQGAKGGTDDLSSLSFYSTLNSAGSSLAIGRDGGAGMASIAWQVSEFTKPAIQQNRFRWRNDDGTEVTATAAGAENASISMEMNTIYRLRFGLFNSDTGSSTNQYRLEFSRKLAGQSCTALTTTVVSAAGTSNFVVPAGVQSITVKAWGAGGGGGGGGSASVAGAGGGGGFARSTMTVIPGETLTVVVGGGGGLGLAAPAGNSGHGGGGGGRSSIFRSSTALLIAGGGGGAGGGDNSSATVGGAGGGGGGTNGVAGSASGTATGGGAGTQTTGGAGGANAAGLTAGAGSSLAGGAGGTSTAPGTGCATGTTGGGGAGGSGGGGAGGLGDQGAVGCAGGGGGGGGLFGGGGGAASTTANAGGGGGGGGSGLVSGDTTTLTAGAGTVPANNGDADYAGSAGVGGAGGATLTNGVAGNPGRVVITYSTGDPTGVGWDWRQVPVAPSTASDSFDMADSPNLTDGAATTNVAGVLTDDDTVFVPGEVKDTGSQTSSIGLASTSFTEIEYSIQANSNAVVGGKYCFRLTDAGEDRPDHSFIYYPQYAEAEITADQVFTQDTLRWYANINDVTVVDPWTPGTSTFASTSFTTAGSTVFAVPTGVTAITVKAWGAGGGGGEGTGAGGTGGNGGGGGFAQAVIPVTAGENLDVLVGTGGIANTGTQVGGDGGGFSSVRRSTLDLVQAGGGGGGGASDGGAGEEGGDGGAGGGSTGVAGQDGGTGNNDNGGGGGGTQSAGGAGGTLGVGTAGTTGAADAGGNGGAAGTGGAGGTGGGGLRGTDTGGGAGGGGGGRFGGGGAANGDNGGVGGGGGGGGGSSGFDTSAVATVNTAGAGTVPGNNGDAYYGGTAGIGGAGSLAAAGAVAGNPGRVVISYATQTSAGSADITESDNEIYAHWAAPMPGTQIRLRMNVTMTGVALATGSAGFTLQFAELPAGTITCANAASWTDMGASTSSSNWRYGSNSAVTDGTRLPTLVLSTSDVRGTYEELNGTGGVPAAVAIGQSIEYDFSLQNNTAIVGSRTCFRLRLTTGAALDAYARYPSIVTQPSPTNEEMLMRHGNFFTVQGDEQPYYWAEIY